MTTSNMLRRLERIKARRQPAGLIIVPPYTLDDRPPTEAERAALIAELEAAADNPNIICVIHTGPRLDAWDLPAGLLGPATTIIRWSGSSVIPGYG